MKMQLNKISKDNSTHTRNCGGHQQQRFGVVGSMESVDGGGDIHDDDNNNNNNDNFAMNDDDWRNKCKTTSSSARKPTTRPGPHNKKPR